MDLVEFFVDVAAAFIWEIHGNPVLDMGANRKSKNLRIIKIISFMLMVLAVGDCTCPRCLYGFVLSILSPLDLQSGNTKIRTLPFHKALPWKTMKV